MLINLTLLDSVVLGTHPYIYVLNKSCDHELAKEENIIRAHLHFDTIFRKNCLLICDYADK